MAFFKRAPYDNPAADTKGQVTTVAGRPQPLEASQLRRVVNPATLAFKTTDELHPITGLIGQDRALKAIQFGANIKSHDFNIFVLGPAASGKTTAVKAHLGPKAAEAPTPADWVYVYNFENPNRPKALQLPHGRGKALARGMVATLDELRSVLPARFESEDYQVRRRAIDEQFRSGQEEALEALNTKAQSQNIAILRTPTGFTMAPMHEGKVVKPEVFNALPETMRKDVETKIDALQKELAARTGRQWRSEDECPELGAGQRGSLEGRNLRLYRRPLAVRMRAGRKGQTATADRPLRDGVAQYRRCLESRSRYGHHRSQPKS
jgi:hypothetical protein